MVLNDPSSAIVGQRPFSELYTAAALITSRALANLSPSRALLDTPLYAAIEIAAKMAITTMTIRSSTSVKPFTLFFEETISDLPPNLFSITYMVAENAPQD